MLRFCSLSPRGDPGTRRSHDRHPHRARPRPPGAARAFTAEPGAAPRDPDVYQGFGALSKAAFADGALERKTKELIALAIGVVEGCDGCIASHGQSAARAGATRQEAAEAIGVTFLMHGGPATVHGARAYAAFCEFADALEAGESPA